MTTTNLMLSWLLTYAVHSTLLLVVAAVAARRIGSPAVREVVWKAALLGGLLTATVYTSGVGTAKATFSLTEPRRSVVPIERPAEPREGTVSERFDLTDKSIVKDRAAKSTVAGGPSVEAKTPWSKLVLGLWAMVAGFLVLGFGVRRWQLARWLGGRRLVIDHPAAAEVAELRRVAGIRRGVVLTVCDRLASPIAVGLSEVSVPGIALRELEPDQRHSMLAHEVAHLVRLDPCWLAIAALMERVFFFQPLNRLARREIQSDAELLCDARAAQWTGSGVNLAKCLVKVAEWIDAAPRPIPVAGLAEERSQLVDRVRRLVEEGPNMSKNRLRLMIAGIGMVLLGTAFVAPKVTLVGQDPNRATNQEPVVARPPVALGPTDAPVLAGKLDGRRGQDTNSAVVPALIEALKDPSADVRRAAAQSLGNIGDRRATPGLVTLLSDENAEARATAAEALGEMQDPRSVAGLAARMDDSVTQVRRAVIQALGRMEKGVSAETFRPALTDEDPEIRQAAAEALGERKDQSSVGALSRMISDKNADVRRSAIQALSNFELEAVPPEVLGALKDGNANVRQAAASMVGNVGDAKAVPALKQMLTDSDADVREAAVNALSEIRDSTAIDALVAGLKSNDPVVRRAAAEALGQRNEK